MEHQINELTQNLSTFKHLFSSWNEELILWKSDKDSWCFLEVACHLLDEEREDFRLRLQTVFNNVEKSFVSIDPVGWVKSRDYIAQDFSMVTSTFFKERELSIDYLKSLNHNDENWSNFINHQHYGHMSSTFFLNNWLAHDYLHIRQLTKIKYDYLKSISDVSIDYAGDWK